MIDNADERSNLRGSGAAMRRRDVLLSGSSIAAARLAAAMTPAALAAAT